jgi:lipoteichoic acid synthase
LARLKGLIYFSYMSLFTVLIVLGFISQLDLNLSEFPTKELPSILSLFSLFFAELCIMLLIGVWFLACNIFVRTLLYIFSSIFIAIYCLQFASFYQGREFISRLAVDNLNHISLLINSETIKGLIFLSFLCLVLPLLIEKKPHQRRWKGGKQIFFSLLYGVLAVGLYQSDYWLPEKVISQRNSYLQEISLPHTAPISALYSTLFLQKSLFRTELTWSDFSPYELNVIKYFGFQYNPTSEYPLIKEDIYSEPEPFEKKVNSPEEPNIIVFFTEGFSARSMNTYGSHYPEITPNIDNFSKSSMVVENYYNHTAATYRGLHGQLCSLFPTYGGNEGWQTNYNDLPEVNYFCLTNVFNRNGYETVFLDAHIEHESQVDEMVTQLGFNRVITGGVLSEKYLADAKPLLKFALSDRQFLKGLVGFLRNHEKNNQKENPFFLSLYNLGTHAFLKRAKDGKKYGRGRNMSLNTINSFDSAFGLFWEYYKTSPYAENTIVIFTTDHCHYPEKQFVDAFKGPGYQQIFVDKIPLIIHDPTRKLPQTFDAKNSTSIDFTPSLIHYLNLGNHKNPFMGTSIYEKERKKYERFGLNSYGFDLFLIDDEKIHKLGTSQNHRVKLKIMDKYITLSKQLEVTDKLWNTALNSEL